MAQRKKLSDMTPMERVSPRLKGLSNEQCEDVAIQILAQVVAKKIYIFGEGVDYFKALMKRIGEAAYNYTKRNAGLLAMGKVIREQELKEKQS